MLVAENVTKRYTSTSGTVTALVDQDLTLALGQRLGLVGPSGCGKSTLARVLALLEPPDSGRVLIDGAAVRGTRLWVPPDVRRRVQLLWQSPRLAVDPRLRLAELMLEPLAAHAELPPTRPQRKTLAREWAERVGLTADLLTRYPHEVSDGQLQRACLARALAVGPRYLIGDEPSSMLDVSTQAALLAAVAEAQADAGFGILLISHDTALIDSWCGDKIRLRPADGVAREGTMGADGR